MMTNKHGEMVYRLDSNSFSGRGYYVAVNDDWMGRGRWCNGFRTLYPRPIREWASSLSGRFINTETPIQPIRDP